MAHRLVVWGLMAAGGSSALAQCGEQWLPGEPAAGADASVYDSVLWDPDGPGPLGEALVVCGGFDLVLGLPATGIAFWDGADWHALPGLPTNEEVNALAVLPDGRLLAAGSFAGMLKVWDGAGWANFSPGMGGSLILNLIVMPNGDLIAMGNGFTSAGGVQVQNIARWDGNAWSSVGLGINGPVTCAAVMPDGDLVVGGSFSIAGTVSVQNVARWDGSEWSAMGAGPSNVSALAVTASGQLLAAGGSSGSIGSTVARWTGTAWVSLGPGMNSGFVTDLLPLASGEVIACGTFETTAGRGISRWTGAAWAPMGTGLRQAELQAQANTLALMGDGRVFVGGMFSSAGGVQAGVRQGGGLALWDGAAWSGFGTSLDDAIRGMALLPDGDVIAVGQFSFTPAGPASYVARWDGAGWKQVGLGLNNWAYCAVGMPNGDIVVGGDFTIAGGHLANRIARWDGFSWHPLGAGSSTRVLALAVLANGNLVAAGNFSSSAGPMATKIAQWDGVAWSSVGLGIAVNEAGGIEDMLALPSGELIVGGSFTVPANRVARWNGSAWSGMGSGFSHNVEALGLNAAGEIVAGGHFTHSGATLVNHVARWTGTAWAPLGAGVGTTIGMPGPIVRDFALTPSGDLIVAGNFTTAGGDPASTIARWDGVAWSALGSGMAGNSNENRQTMALAALPSGEIVAGGFFSIAGGHASNYFARWTDDNIPWFAHDPQQFNSGVGGTVTLTATPADGYDAITFQWQRETAPGSGVYADLVDGPGGASAGGGTVAGASGLVNGGTTLVLTISDAAVSDSGMFRARVSNACGAGESESALVTVLAPCPPDLTTGAVAGSPGYGVPDGVLNNDDFFYFLAQFAAGNAAVVDMTTAAVPGSPGYGVPNGVINNDDFFYYLALYAAGC